MMKGGNFKAAIGKEMVYCIQEMVKMKKTYQKHCKETMR